MNIYPTHLVGKTTSYICSEKGRPILKLS